MIARGLTSVEIGTKLNLSPKTVETHRFNLYRKLGVNSIAALTRIAVEEERKVRSMSEARHKANYVGAPAIFALEQACQIVNDAFGIFGCYLVGSCLERADWRDVDVRFIMGDAEFTALFPEANLISANWEHDPRWLLMSTTIANWMRERTGLPVDFQFQPQTFANERHKGARHAIGMRVRKD